MPTALITGASSGIGWELARLHAARSGDLIAVGRNAERLRELATELQSAHGVRVHTVATDLATTHGRDEVEHAVTALGQPIDYLINNAGFGGVGLFVERPAAEDLGMVDVNVVALTDLTKRFLPGMVERGSGAVLNVGSTAGLVPGPGQAVYFATKAYVSSLSNALASETAGTGVSVTALLPGPTQSQFGERSGMAGTPLFSRTTSAEVVAYAGYEGMLRGDLEVVVGLPGPVNRLARLAAVLPRRPLMAALRRAQAGR